METTQISSEIILSGVNNSFLKSPPYRTTDDVTIIPGQGIIDSRSDAQIYPFIWSAPMETVTGRHLTGAMLDHKQYAVVSRFIEVEERRLILKKYGRESKVFFAIGLDEASSFLNTVAEVADENEWPSNSKINIALDIAHGDMIRAHELTAFMARQRFVRYVMSGSICTPAAALRAVQDGCCTHLRVGIGPGAACSTRVMTGVGIPNLSAVYMIREYLSDNDYEPYVIADGGISEPGQVAKYLSAGADGVMLGSVLSRTLESAGWELVPEPVSKDQVLDFTKDRNQVLQKTFRGQASAEFQSDVLGRDTAAPEGVSTKPFIYDGKTTVASVLAYFTGGVQSSISYTGGSSIGDLDPNTVQMAPITLSGHIEGKPNVV